MCRNTTNPDNSGNLKFLAYELQEAEEKGERVWLVGHVLTGWDGTNPLPNPTGESLSFSMAMGFGINVISCRPVLPDR